MNATLRCIKLAVSAIVATCVVVPSAWGNISATKSFSPATISAGQQATLTITITNSPKPGNPGNLSFTDTYPAGLVNAATPGVTNTCGGTTTAAPGGNTLSLSGSTTLSGNTYCTITVNVTPAAAGSYVNSVTVSSTANTAVASATLVVTSVVGSFNAFETSTPAGRTTGAIQTKIAGTAFALDVVAIASGGGQATTFNDNVKVELVVNYGASCTTSGQAIQTIPSAAIVGGRSTVSFAAVPDVWQGVAVRISYPTTLPTTISCSSSTFAILPDHFDTVVTPNSPMNCAPGLVCPNPLYNPANSMTYSGQSFSVTVTAKNASDVTTQNYDGTKFSRLVTLTAAVSAGGVAITPTVGSITASATVPAASFALGTTTATPTFTFSTAPTVPTGIYVRATDTDGVSSLLPSPNSANSVEGGIEVVSGRLNIANAYGSELLQLPISVTAQYWNGTNWVTSSTDNVTSLNATQVMSSNWTNFTPGNWLKLSSASGWGPGATSAISPTSFTLVNGLGSFTLAAPGSGKTGSVDISLSSPAYLVPSNTARAAFGVYRGVDSFIYQRENY